MIELPWPPAALSPNARSRSHWPRTRALAKARSWAWIAAQGSKAPDEHPIGLLLTFYPPDRRSRDRDNLLASCKPYLDGIAQAWKVDDATFDPRIQIGEPVKGGKVVVTLP